ncbi:Zinc finger TFIIB-type domain protein [Ignisphaera aggregans DSM 17230]|uniref:Zinc finger TFIIB-type domain protein n=1 Tax=Ignisphaera aggregans (strain DSM 17230 / JCM 13409 / AQ1.S1) TaxID=583356 RepID=E0SPE2_IGNAA|nr:Zinc finger TFIIB-type domain protein [Ignisphaera aggregans DSM 17230]
MSCPYCKSQNIIHDFTHGYVVCGECGTIIDELYIEFFENTSYEEAKPMGLPTVREGLNKKVARAMGMYIAKLSHDVAVYEKYAKRARKGVRVDLEMIQRRLAGDKVRVYRHESEDKLRELIEGDAILRSIIDRIIDRDPLFSSRTLRGKIALALIIKQLITRGDIDYEEIARQAHMSKTHIKRLVKLLKLRYRDIASIKMRIAIKS